MGTEVIIQTLHHLNAKILVVLIKCIHNDQANNTHSFIIRYIPRIRFIRANKQIIIAARRERIRDTRRKKKQEELSANESRLKIKPSPQIYARAAALHQPSAYMR